MHRKLIHTFRALGLVLSLATAALITAVSAPGATEAVSTRGTVAAPATVAPEAKTGSAKAHNHHRRAQAREAMALPFFSFAQGLRSGNRS
jgi:hypothetical protein